MAEFDPQRVLPPAVLGALLHVRATEPDRQATGLDDETRVHVAKAVVRRVAGDEFGKPRGVPTETGRGESLSGRARRRMRAGIVGLQKHLGVAVAGDDRHADVVTFGGTGLEGRIRGACCHR